MWVHGTLGSHVRHLTCDTTCVKPATRSVDSVCYDFRFRLPPQCAQGFQHRIIRSSGVDCKQNYLQQVNVNLQK